MYRKVTPDAEIEAATMSWLRTRGLPVAEVVDIGPDWLVTREISGRTAADTWPEDLRPRVVDALAEVTRALHALPVDECPFDRSLATVATEAREAAVSGRIDLGDLDHERQGWTAAQPARYRPSRPCRSVYRPGADESQPAIGRVEPAVRHRTRRPLSEPLRSPRGRRGQARLLLPGGRVLLSIRSLRASWPTGTVGRSLSSKR